MLWAACCWRRPGWRHSSICSVTGLWEQNKVRIVPTPISGGGDLFSLVKCDWSLIPDSHSLQFDCGLKRMRPNLGDLIVLKSPENIFVGQTRCFSSPMTHSSTVSWGMSGGTRVRPRSRQSTTPGTQQGWILCRKCGENRHFEQNIAKIWKIYLWQELKSSNIQPALFRFNCKIFN